MKIQYLNGGLANQTFQYIFARYHDLTYPNEEPMLLDDSFFFVQQVHNGYELENVFQLHPNLLSHYFDSDVWEFMIEEKRKGKSIPQIMLENDTPIRMVTDSPSFADYNPFNGPVASAPSNQYTPYVLKAEGDIYYNGYWINQGWFHEYESVFRQELAFPPLTEPHNLEFAKKIQESNSLAVHIRRGDFVKLNFSWPAEKFFHCLKALSRILKDGSLFVFSDDITWCEEHADELGISFFSEVTFVSGNQENGLNYRDLQLMTLCHNLIHTPSSFGYLSILLNPNHHIFSLISADGKYYVKQVY